MTVVPLTSVPFTAVELSNTAVELSPVALCAAR